MINITEDMFKSGQPIAQGEVLIWMTKYAPQAVLDKLAGLTNMKNFELEKGKMILGHSETGHHHILEPVQESKTIDQVAKGFIDDLNDTFIKLELFDACKFVHLRSNDTHGGFILPPGEYIRGLREEQTVDGWRRVAD